MNKIPLLINPCARSSKLTRISRWVSLHGDAFRITESKSRGHLLELAAEYAAQGEPVVAVAGGDGTQETAATALLGSDTALGVIPSGTVNVFARELGIFDAAFDKAWQAIVGGAFREVDIFLANGEPFLQMAGVGLDARAIELTDRRTKRKLGPLAYLLAGIKAMGERTHEISITTEEGVHQKGIAAIFGNGARYGGPMTVFGEANHSDGLLDIILFHGTTTSLIVDSLFALLKGGFSSRISGNFDYIRTTGCRVEASRPTPYERDGDLAGTTPLEIKRSPSLLKVCVLPAQATP